MSRRPAAQGARKVPVLMSAASKCLGHVLVSGQDGQAHGGEAVLADDELPVLTPSGVHQRSPGKPAPIGVRDELIGVIATRPGSQWLVLASSTCTESRSASSSTRSATELMLDRHG
jgi:hypothetical protein